MHIARWWRLGAPLLAGLWINPVWSQSTASGVQVFTGADNGNIPYSDGHGTHASLAVTDDDWDSSMSGSATSTYGSMKAEVSVNVKGDGSRFVQVCSDPGTLAQYWCGSGNVATASSSFTDTWVLHGGTGQGTLSLTLDVDGTTHVDSTLPDTGGMGVSTGADIKISYRTVGSATWQTALWTTVSGSTQLVSDPISFTYGTSIEFEFSTQAFIHIVDSPIDLAAEWGQGPGAYQVQADSSFGHTVVLSSIKAFDSLGHENLGLSIASASGTGYPVTAVPEASSTLLAVLGLIPVGCALRRRRKAGH